MSRSTPCGVAALVLAALACTPAPAAAPSRGAIDLICANVVGLPPGEKHFEACADSLAQSLETLQSGQSLSAARRDCLARGMRPGTPELSECELTSRTSLPPEPAADSAVVPRAIRSYFTISREVAFRRDEMACARLGFDPAEGEAFARCAAQLRAALARASMPAM